MVTAASRVRAEARSAMSDAILEAAGRQLAEVGAAALSVRAVAREVGMASSAIYRYVASRDELLTMLIIDGYNAIGAAAEAADASVGDRNDLAGRFAAISNGVRRWAKENPHRYALLYGSPVPGYVAPEATIVPATRAALLLGELLVAAPAAARSLEGDGGESGLERGVAGDLLSGVSEESARRGVLSWVELFGLVSFELFGHLVGSVADADRFFDRAIEDMVARMGLL